MTETGDDDASDAPDAAPDDPASPPDPGARESEATRRAPGRRADQLTPAEREFIRRYAEEFPPHHESRWG